MHGCDLQLGLASLLKNFSHRLTDLTTITLLIYLCHTLCSYSCVNILVSSDNSVCFDKVDAVTSLWSLIKLLVFVKVMSLKLSKKLNKNIIQVILCVFSTVSHNKFITIIAPFNKGLYKD